MIVRLNIPFHGLIDSPVDSKLKPGTQFEHNGYKVKVLLRVGQAVQPFLPEENRQYRPLSLLRLEISGGVGGQAIDALAMDDKPEALAAAMRPIINRVFRAIRNFGFISQLEEFRTDGDLSAELSAEWNPQSTEDRKTWKPLFPMYRSPLFKVLQAIPQRESRRIREERWPFIEEALQDNLEPGPEREFLTNSIQHLGKSNFRLALLEAIICLEIVLNGFLRLYFGISCGLSATRIERTLDNLGLTSRVGLILEVVLNKRERQAAEIENVLRAVKWRNEIVHKTGRLPSGAAEESLRESVWATLQLAQLLASKRDDLASRPDAAAMADQLSKTHGVDVQEMKFLDSHRVTLRVHSGFEKKPLSDSEIAEIVADISARCKARDTRFVSGSHLSIAFTKGLLATYALWANGKLERFAQPESMLAAQPTLADMR